MPATGTGIRNRVRPRGCRSSMVSPRESAQNLKALVRLKSVTVIRSMAVVDAAPGWRPRHRSQHDLVSLGGYPDLSGGRADRCNARLSITGGSCHGEEEASSASLVERKT